MEKRKNPEKDLRKQSGLFFQIGLLTALMLAVCAFEYRVEKVDKPVDIGSTNGIEDPTLPIVVFDPPPPPPKAKVLVNPVPTTEPDPEPLPDDAVIDTHELPVIPVPVPQPIEEEVADYPTYVEQMPAPDGGYEAFYKYLNKNLQFTNKARNMGIDGKVFVQFVIDENGKITEVKTVKGVGAGLDEEAERVLAAAPNWIAGRQGGKKVKVRMIIPITFKLAN